MDEYDTVVRDALAARDRTIAQQSREIATLVAALALHEGRDEHVTALAHLGQPDHPAVGRAGRMNHG